MGGRGHWLSLQHSAPHLAILAPMNRCTTWIVVSAFGASRREMLLLCLPKNRTQRKPGKCSLGVLSACRSESTTIGCLRQVTAIGFEISDEEFCHVDRLVAHSFSS